MSKLGQYSFIPYLSVLLIFTLLSAKKATAQIIPDNTLPVNSQVQPGCTTCEINGGTIEGTNLFHSFREFSVPTNGQAFFNNRSEIQNILTRVTGNYISNIDGLIRANGSANLFFINPNGIVFGKNASVNISGSFVVSTANSIKFADGTEFNTQTSQNTPLLTINAPIGLQFGSNQGKIQVQAKNGLQVQPNKTLALVGGDISLTGTTLATSGGQIELGSVKQAGLVNLTSINQGFLLGYEGINNFGDIQLSDGTNIDTSSMVGGAIRVNTGNLRIIEDSRMTSLNSGSVPGRSMTINATNTIEVIGTGKFDQAVAEILNPAANPADRRNGFFTLSVGTGSGGNFEMNTGKLILKNGALILVSAFGQGNGGNLRLNATKSVEINESLLATGNRTGSSGNSGNIEIKTQNLLLQNRAIISSSSFGNGKAGDISINALDSINITGVQNFSELNNSAGINTRLVSITSGSGDAGNLTIQTKRLQILNGGLVTTSTSGSGDAGNLIINAADMQVIGTDSNIRARSNLLATGAAGNIRLRTNTLKISDGAKITVEVRGGGNAGTISISSDSILLDNAATITANTSSENIDPDQEQASINLRAQDFIMRRGSRITTNAIGKNVNGGNITINTAVLGALENSDISANSTGSRGGRVIINAQGIFGTEFRPQPTLESDITATGANPQLNGTVQLNTPDVDPTSGLIELPINIVDTQALLANNICSQQQIAKKSSFVIIGRGGRPPEADELISNSPGVVEWLTRRETKDKSPAVLHQQPKPKTDHNITENITHPVIQEAQGWIITADGRVILTAEPANVTLQTSGLTHPSCHLSNTQ
jgi:filamentous hemagglutinin family protein